MFEIMTVCTGNICRSPLAEQLLRTRLADLPGTITSAGTYGLDGVAMTDEAQQLAAQLGVDADMSAAHSATPLTEKALRSENLVLVLGMAREHRRRIVEFAPSKLKSTFTVREFARLAADTPDADIVASADAAGTDAAARLRAAVVHRRRASRHVDAPG